MTISSYHVDSVISAYNKQSRMKVKQSPSSQQEKLTDKSSDTVSLSQKAMDQAEAYKKISYNIIDTILKDKGI